MRVLWFLETVLIIKKQNVVTEIGMEKMHLQIAIRRWLQQSQETGSVLYRRGVE
jgi:hypothetical protein